MTPKRQRQADLIFTELAGREIDLADEVQCRPLLAELCGDDADLRAAVEVLVREYGEAEGARSRMRQIAAPAFSRRTLLNGSMFGNYVIEGVLGRGGMGTVYRATFRSLGRQVALKVLDRFEEGEPRALARFLKEARIAAQLHHTNIVEVFDVNIGDDIAYYAMRLIEGRSLREVIRDHFSATAPEHLAGARGLDEDVAGPHLLQPPRDEHAYFRWVATVGAQAADALAYAHGQPGGIVHRDIKPANLLLDNRGQLWVTDFGLARRTDDAELTRSDSLPGTPAYMSPEQCSGSDVGPLSDVYNLGVTLYELLTGRRAFPGHSMPKIQKAICDSDFISPRRLVPTLDKSLETIVLKAMSYRLEGRYRSAQELADDLRRWLAHEPVHARRITPVGKLRLWWEREPLVAGLTAALFLALLVGTLVSTRLWWRATASLVAVSEQKRAAEHARGDALRAAAAEERAAAEADKQRRVAEARLFRLQTDAVERALHERRYADAVLTLRGVSPEQAGWDTKRQRFESLAAPTVSLRLSEHETGILSAVLSPDGHRCVSAGCDGRLLVWDVRSGRVTNVLCQPRRFEDADWSLGYFRDREASPFFEAEGEYFTGLAWLGAGEDVAGATVRGEGVVIDTRSGRLRTVLRAPDRLTAVATTPVAATVLFGGNSGRVYLCTTGTESSLLRARALSSSVLAARWIPLFRVWAVGCADGRLSILDGTDLTPLVETAFPGPLWSLDAVEDGRRVLLTVGTRGHELSVHALAGSPLTLQRLQTIDLPDAGERSGAVHAVRFAGGGEEVYAIDDLGRLVCWRRGVGFRWVAQGVNLGGERFVLLGKSDRAERFNRRLSAASNWLEIALRFSAPRFPATSLVSRALSPAVTRLRLDASLPLSFHRIGTAILLPGDGRIVTAGMDMVIKVWEEQPDDGVSRIRVGASPRVAFDAGDARRLWSLAADGTLTVTDWPQGKPVTSVRAHGTGGSSLAVTAEGGIVTAGRDGKILRWSLERGRLTDSAVAPAHTRPLLAIGAAHRRRLLAAVDDRATLVLYDVDRKCPTASAPINELGGATLGASRLAFGLDDTYIAAFGDGQACAVFRTEGLQRLDAEPPLGGSGTALIWPSSVPGSVLLADDSSRYKHWLLPGIGSTSDLINVRAGKRSCVAFAESPDGRRVIALERSGRLLSIDPTYNGIVLSRQTTSGAACDVAIDPRGQFVAAAHEGGTVEVWRAGQVPRVTTPDTPARPWVVTRLVDRVHGRIALDPRGIGFDTDGRLAAAFIVTPMERDPTGRLFFAREGGSVTEPEPVDTEGVVSPHGYRLTVRGRDPLIVYRREPAKDSLRTVAPEKREGSGAYDGTVCVARREQQGRWSAVALPIEGNIGHYPEVLSRDGHEELFVFAFAHYGWHRLFQEQGTWTDQILGRRGDGQELLSSVSADGVLHGVFRTNRFNSDPGPPVYAAWDGQTLRREVIDPRFDKALSLQLSRDGSPLVLLGNTETRESTLSLARRVGDAWALTRLGGAPNGPGINFVVHPDGRVSGVSCESGLHVWEWDGDRWRAERVEAADEGTPAWAHPVMDASGQMSIVFVSKTGRDEDSGITVLRPGQ